MIVEQVDILEVVVEYLEMNPRLNLALVKTPPRPRSFTSTWRGLPKITYPKTKFPLGGIVQMVASFFLCTIEYFVLKRKCMTLESIVDGQQPNESFYEGISQEKDYSARIRIVEVLLFSFLLYSGTRECHHPLCARGEISGRKTVYYFTVFHCIYIYI